MKKIRKSTAFLLAVCAALLVPACGLGHGMPVKTSREYVIRQKTEEPLREWTAAPVPAGAEMENTADSAPGKNRLPAMGCVGGLVSLMAVALLCAAKNRNRRNCV